MTLPVQLEVESNLVGYLPDIGGVRARYRVPNLPTDASMDVAIRARVYDLAQVRSLGMLPSSGPIQDGPELDAKARSDWSVIDLPLPRLQYGEYAVVAKVYSRDKSYRADFAPSHCWVGELAYGLRPIRMKLSEVLAMYRGVGNPLVEDALKNQIRDGLVVAEDETGALFSMREVDGRLEPTPLPGHRTNR